MYTHTHIFFLEWKKVVKVYVYQDTFFKMEKGATLHTSTLLTSSTHPKS